METFEEMHQKAGGKRAIQSNGKATNYRKVLNNQYIPAHLQGDNTIWRAEGMAGTYVYTIPNSIENQLEVVKEKYELAISKNT